MNSVHILLVAIVCLLLILIWMLRGIHIQWNSRMDQLLATTRSLALAEGKATGIIEERDREEK